jgi:hypothetical protein
MSSRQKGTRKGADEGHVKRDKTNFDLYLEEQVNDPAFAERFEEAGETWDIALQAASICKL